MRQPTNSFAALLVVGFLLPTVISSAETAQVTRVVDGDTLVVEIAGQTERVRLIGVDTPETVHPQKPVEYFGKEASAFTKRLAEGQTVRPPEMILSLFLPTM